MLSQIEKLRIQQHLPDIRLGYKLRWLGTHGASHWARVILNGLILSDLTGADRDVLVMFGLFHDSRRVNDLHDPPHGKRGGKLARQLLSKDSHWPPEKTDVLIEACNGHTAIRHHEDITIQTCWDADRLDLPRIGAIVDCDYLGTWALDQDGLIESASERGRSKVFPFEESFTKFPPA